MTHAKKVSALIILLGLMPAASVTARAQSTTRKPARKGQSEGIKVHGHWTVEVRNPDGKLVTHREFENSLVPVTGAFTLELMILGNNPPQSYQIVLQAPNNSSPSTCIANFVSTQCVLNENIPASGSCATGSQNVFCSVTRSPALGTAPSLLTGPPVAYQPITFQGSFTAPQTGSVGYVGLNVNLCQSITPGFNTPTPYELISEADCINGNYTSANGQVLQAYNLTGTTLSSPVSVLAGQIVSASVAISFQ
jgi:hypothetical protein